MKHVCNTNIRPSIELLNNVTFNRQCEICGANFPTYSKLCIHLSTTHNISSEEEISKYYKLGTMSKKKKTELKCTCAYFCPQIGCRYNRSQLSSYKILLDHFKRQHLPRGPPVKCVECGFVVRYPQDLYQHMNRLINICG